MAASGEWLDNGQWKSITMLIFEVENSMSGLYHNCESGVFLNTVGNMTW